MVYKIPFAPIIARFFRFTALTEVNGNNATSAAEIFVLPAEAEDRLAQQGLVSVPKEVL